MNTDTTIPQPEKEKATEPLAAPTCSPSLPPIITLRADDWHLLCVVMRDLTWGSECMDTWHRLRERVSKRNAENDLVLLRARLDGKSDAVGWLMAR